MDPENNKKGNTGKGPDFDGVWREILKHGGDKLSIEIIIRMFDEGRL